MKPEFKLDQATIDKIKEDALFWSNNCGGCETCSQTFGGRDFTMNPETAFALAHTIELQQRKIRQLRVEVVVLFLACWGLALLLT